MKALVKPREYYAHDTLLEENDKLFRKIWHFAGFLHDYVNENDFTEEPVMRLRKGRTTSEPSRG